MLPVEVRFALSSITVGERYFDQFQHEHEYPVWVNINGDAVSPCGVIKTAAYCPADTKFYVDLAALERMWGRFGAVIISEVIWHEMAHWWQDVEHDRLFLYQRIDNRYDREVVELPADCYSGKITKFSGVFSADEVARAAGLFGTIGSGASSTHGSNDQRRQSFMSCYNEEQSTLQR